MKTITAVLLMCGALTACKGKDKEASAPAAKPETAETKPAAPTPTEAVAKQPIETAAVTQAAVDICAIVARAEVEKVLGALDLDPMPQTAAGSFLGGCAYSIQGGAVAVSARPVAEYDATVKAMGDAAPVPGIGEAAAQGKSGLFVKVAGKPYFLHIMTPGSAINADKAVELAKLYLK